MRFSFRRKALLFMIPVLIIVSTISTCDSVQTQKEIARNEIIKRSEVVTTLAGKTGELAVLSKNETLLKTAATLLKGVSDVVFVVFYDNNMNLLAHEGMSVPNPQVRTPSDLSITYVEKSDYFDFFAPVYTEREKEDIDMFEDTGRLSHIKEKIGLVRIGFSKASMQAAEREMVVRGFVLAVIFIIGTGIVVSVFITLVTRPLTALHGAVTKLAKGGYPEMKGISSHDEIGELATAFDKMSMAIKKRESRLIESERQLRNLFERVEHAVFRLDANGDVIRTNRKFDDLCGGKDRFSLLFSKEREGHLLKRAASGELKGVEEKILDKNGNELRVLMSVYPDLDEKNNVTTYDGYFVDITEKKKLEESLLQAQKMESIGMLAGGIAHDFNNILTGILGYTFLIKESLTPETDKNYRYIDIIEKSAERAANFTRQLVDFARKGKYIVTKLSVNDIARELAGFLRGTFDRKISLIVDIEENLPPVEGDSNQLYQAIMNLCINARDAMPDGGRLSIKTDRYQLQEAEVVDFFQIPPGVYVRISITDTGSGMTPEVKKRMFEPFYTTKDTGKGTGLGLAVVYGIVKNHGGYIAVFSEPGQGTTVSIYLPEAQGAPEEQRGRETGGWKTQKGTILIIDDEEVIRNLVKDILEACNYTVLSAAHGNEGIKIFDENKDRIDLVILDMVMPEKNGRETFQELKAVSADLKILLCSGYEQETYLQELFEAGASGLLQKPFQHRELIKKVREALEG